MKGITWTRTILYKSNLKKDNSKQEKLKKDNSEKEESEKDTSEKVESEGEQFWKRKIQKMIGVEIKNLKKDEHEQ